MTSKGDKYIGCMPNTKMGSLGSVCSQLLGRGDFGMYDDMWLTAEEWDRLAKWVEFQRADERIGHEATP